MNQYQASPLNKFPTNQRLNKLNMKELSLSRELNPQKQKKSLYSYYQIIIITNSKVA